jgi:hypothetical protein
MKITLSTPEKPEYVPFDEIPSLHLVRSNLRDECGNLLIKTDSRLIRIISTDRPVEICFPSEGELFKDLGKIKFTLETE